jgi:hypothetical protein
MLRASGREENELQLVYRLSDEDNYKEDVGTTRTAGFTSLHGESGKYLVSARELPVLNIQPFSCSIKVTNQSQSPR